MSDYELARAFEMLAARVDAIGEDATQSQSDSLVDWIVTNIPQPYWMAAAEDAILIRSVYTEMSMRCGECGFF